MTVAGAVASSTTAGGGTVTDAVASRASGAATVAGDVACVMTEGVSTSGGAVTGTAAGAGPAPRAGWLASEPDVEVVMG